MSNFFHLPPLSSGEYLLPQNPNETRGEKRKGRPITPAITPVPSDSPPSSSFKRINWKEENRLAAFQEKLAPLIRSGSSMVEDDTIFPMPSAAKLNDWKVGVFSKDESNQAIFADQEIAIEEKRFLGEGKFTKVYQASSEKDAHQYAYKMEKTPRLIDINSFGEKFWRHSHFAADRLELPHVVKAVSYIITVRVSDGRKQKFFLPADKAKEFGQELQQIDPAAIVELEAELTEYAPGKTLAELIKDKSISFDPKGIHFQKVFSAIHEFLEKAYAANFIHRDLKPANIMYDPVSGIVTIIDLGEASRLQSREKKFSTPKGPSNPTTSEKSLGSRNFMSPRMIEGFPYGSEVDFFSAAMLLLNLINPKEFETFTKNRSLGSLEDIFLSKSPEEFLPCYLETCGSDSKTSKVLEENPLLKHTLELYFQVSSTRTLEEKEASKNSLTQLFHSEL